MKESKNMVSPGQVRDAVRSAAQSSRGGTISAAILRERVRAQIPGVADSSIRSAAQKYLERVSRGVYRLPKSM